MKFILVAIALVTSPLFATGVQAERVPVTERKSGAGHYLHGGADGRSADRHRGEHRSGEGISSGKNVDQGTGSTLPEKKPRLKYRDDPRCAC